MGGLAFGLFSTVNLTMISDDKWYQPYARYGLYGALINDDVWYAPLSDDDAAFYAYFIVPQTRSDWKICIIHRLTISSGSVQDMSGRITVGAVGDGDLNTYGNIFSYDNMDLTIDEAQRIYHAFSDGFSASAGDRMRVLWQKDDDPLA